jgi:hypothetical protein
VQTCNSRIAPNRRLNDFERCSCQRPRMSEEREWLTLRQIDQLRVDIASVESGQEFLMHRVNALPSASDLWRAATLIGLIGGVLGIVGMEWLHRYFACGSI